MVADPVTPSPVSPTRMAWLARRSRASARACMSQEFRRTRRKTSSAGFKRPCQWTRKRPCPPSVSPGRTPPTSPHTSIRQSKDRQNMITLADARRVIAAAEQKAAEIGQPMNIAVVDAGGNLVAHVRMDNAWMGSIDISINKAWTSRAFDIATKDLAGHSQSGNQFFGIHASNHGRVMIFAGGIPLKRGGQVVGAIGVSGGSGDQDHAVAEAGAAAF